MSTSKGSLSRCHDTRASIDRKGTRLNSSHLVISYAVFCLKKQKAHLQIPCLDRGQRAAACSFRAAMLLLVSLVLNVNDGNERYIPVLASSHSLGTTSDTAC